MVNNLKDIFNSGITKNIDNRLACLHALEESIIFYEQEIFDSLWQDLHKSKEESYIAELSMIYRDIRLFKNNLKKWAKKKKCSTPLFLLPSKSYIINIPYGVSLIVSPWNYPILLLFQPLVASLAAGNVVLLKPSPTSVNCTMITYKIIEKFNNLLKDKIKGLNGNIVSVEPFELLNKDNFLGDTYNHIFFTGGSVFGKVIAAKASQDLTPIVLELGGKSPSIITEQANIEIATRKIIWAKLMNAGQTCVAPDYLLVHKSIKDKVIASLISQINSQYPNISINKSYGRIISIGAFERLQTIIDKYISKNKIIYGGNYDYVSRYIEPTLINCVSLEDEEIFGPLLPIIEYDNIAQVYSIISSQPTPLALYYFGDTKEGDKIMQNIPSGGGCVNDCIIHLSNLSLPFGGMGASGMGKYHGKYGYNTFSHTKGYMISQKNIDNKIKYPPYSKFDLIKKILRISK